VGMREGANKAAGVVAPACRRGLPPLRRSLAIRYRSPYSDRSTRLAEVPVNTGFLVGRESPLDRTIKGTLLVRVPTCLTF
jgi:hypothetical protein